MSSVPAPRMERLPLFPRTEASAPDRAAASLRLVPSVPELYPGFVATLRAAFRMGRARRVTGVSVDLAELGRATGARI